MVCTYLYRYVKTANERRGYKFEGKLEVMCGRVGREKEKGRNVLIVL